MDAEDLDSIRTGGSCGPRVRLPLAIALALYGLAPTWRGNVAARRYAWSVSLHRRRRARADRPAPRGRRCRRRAHHHGGGRNAGRGGLGGGDLADRQRQRGDRLRHRHRLRCPASPGPPAAASAVRRWITPYLRQPRIAYAGLAVLLLLLFWWDPFPATHRLPPSLLLIALLALGVEVLRRQVIREFPDLHDNVAKGMARMADQMRAARQRRVSTGEGPAAARGRARRRLRAARGSSARTVS